MKFEIITQDKNCRAKTAKLHTDHGVIKTPAFMPVGTLGAIKGMHVKDLEEQVNPDIILGNTYHLYLRPGVDLIEKAGGLHKFESWDRPILTDSGGYQVYSLAQMRKISEEGVQIQSHIDGSKHFFSPESVMDIQRQIGADIIMAFDECTPYPCEYDYAKNSMHLTHRWLKRCCDRFDSTNSLFDYEQHLFPIVQGSVYKDLRKQAAEYVASLDRAGNAIGGLSVGEPDEMMYEMADLVCDILPDDKPRYLMGVGTPWNILENVALGIDMFDCVLPTRNARHGLLYTKEGTINIKNKKWEDDLSPIDSSSPSFASRRHSKAYLRHLIKSNELTGIMIATLHNLSFYMWLMDEIRTRIEDGTFVTWKNKMVKQLAQRL